MATEPVIRDMLNDSYLLVPCDFSPASMAGLSFAAELSDRLSLPLVCLTIIEPGISSIDNVKIFSKLFDDFVSSWPKILEITHVIEQGRFLPAVLEQIEKEKPCIIVLGTNGARGWDGLFMGSHAEKLVRTSTVPVLAVRSELYASSIKNIVVPFSEASDP